MPARKLGAHRGGKFGAKVDQHKNQLADIARPDSFNRRVAGHQMFGQSIHCGEKKDSDGEKGYALAGGGKGRLEHEISLGFATLCLTMRARAQGQGPLALGCIWRGGKGGVDLVVCLQQGNLTAGFQLADHSYDLAHGLLAVFGFDLAAGCRLFAQRLAHALGQVGQDEFCRRV